MNRELTSCRTCSKEVAKSATVCPHCGAKLKFNLVEKVLLFIVVSWVAIFVYVVIGERLINK